MTITVLEPHGFCAGVAGALRKAVSAASESSPQSPIYCLHELVHNELVVADLRRRGFVFVESLSDVPDGATLLFSAHGVAPSVRDKALARGMKLIDATCPFVMRVHRAARAFRERGLSVVVIGKRSHAEVQGILGEAPDATVVGSVDDALHLSLPPGAPRRLGVVSQTTMNADDVKAIVSALSSRFEVETLAEVCNATKERQDAVKSFDGDALLVLGSAASSNTSRLCEVSRAEKVFRAGSMDELRAIDFSGISSLGVTSGASTPESFLEEAVEWLLA